MAGQQEIAGNQPAAISPAAPKAGIENPRGRNSGVFVFHITWNSYILLPTGIIAYAGLKCNILRSGDGGQRTFLDSFVFLIFIQNSLVFLFRTCYSKHTFLRLSRPYLNLKSLRAFYLSSPPWFQGNHLILTILSDRRFAYG